MQILFALAGLLALIFGGWVAASIKSDIQIQIVATCLIGGGVLIGQSAILDQLAKLRDRLKDNPPA